MRKTLVAAAVLVISVFAPTRPDPTPDPFDNVLHLEAAPLLAPITTLNAPAEMPSGLPSRVPVQHTVAAPIEHTTTTLPGWGGPIPAYYGGDTGCDQHEASLVARAMWVEGAGDDSVEWMLGIISRESACDSTAHNGDRSTGDDSWGLCQLNVLAGHFGQAGILTGWDHHRFATDFAYNAAACARLWAVCGRGPWVRPYGCELPDELR